MRLFNNNVYQLFFDWFSGCRGFGNPDDQKDKDAKNACCIGQCEEGEGDCDKDEDCKGDLVCGTDNCRVPQGILNEFDDCCMVKVKWF